MALGFLLLGCGTTPVNDWPSRIGQYTYSQAEAELGKPAKTTSLDNGGVFAEWLTRRNVMNPANTGLDTGMRAGGVIQQPNQAAVQSSLKNEYLDLTFAPNGKLSKAEKVYHTEM
jgi:hypothetical protein